MDAAISRLHFPVTALGPGRRIGLWFQGCSLHCPGCISVDTWEHGVGKVPVSELVGQLAAYAGDAHGLTISGGEPLEQPDALAVVLKEWRKLSDRSVLLFTGRGFPELGPWLSVHPGLVDAIIAGPFRSDLPQTKALRGSDNQSLHVLTPLGQEFLAFERIASEADRRLDVMFDEEGHAWMAGIPSRGDIGRLRRALVRAGHQAETSDMRSGFAA